MHDRDYMHEKYVNVHVCVCFNPIFWPYLTVYLGLIFLGFF